MSTPGPPLKKRNRKILVCTNCRQKKNKCDRQLPCTSCVKLGLKSSCFYSDDIRPTLSTVNDIQHHYNMMLKEEQPSQVATVATSSIFPFAPVDPKDPATSLLWEYWSYKIRDKQFSHFTLSRHFVGLSYGKLKELEDSTHSSGAIDYRDLDTGDIKIQDTKRRMSIAGQSVGLIYYPKNLKNLSVIQRIKHLMPSQIQLTKYQKLFFEKLSLHIPIIDEYEYLESAQRIFNIVTPTNDPITKLNVSSKYDYALIAQTLLVLRLVYCFLVLEDKFNSDLDAPIYLETVDLAEECLSIHGIFKQPTLASLQALLLLQNYREVAPERQDGFLGDQTLRGHILELAYDLGLHRDPKHFDLGTLDMKVAHLRRKIWMHIYQSNVFAAVFYWRINRYLIHDFDTEWPQFQQGLSNVQNLVNEKKAVDGFTYVKPVVKTLAELLKLGQTVQPDYRGIDMLEYTEQLNNHLSNVTGNFKEITENTSPGFFKLMRVKWFVLNKMCLSLFLYTGYIQYEEKGQYEDSYKCLHKSLSLLFGELGEILISLKDCNEVYGETFKLFLLPVIWKMVHLIITIALNLITRIKCTISEVSSNENDFELTLKLNQWLGMVKKFMLVRFKRFIDLSITTQVVNKLLKLALNNLLIAMDEDGLYKLFPQLVTECSLHLNYQQVDGLIEVFRKSWHTVEGEAVSDFNIFTVSDILKADENYHQRLADYIKFDKLWIAKTIINMYNENDVPTDESDNGDEEVIFNYKEAPFKSIPAFKGVLELISE